MFWSGNYIGVRELKSLLKEENVTLTQVLEADDILQECKADNKLLIQFLTRPDILSELITLIIEEPPKDVELSSQYRHASIACEVLTSQISFLSDCLSMDATQMHRLCNFINREEPLNPLLASYFSKIIEMLTERTTKQDWYQYHIVCLRVLDFLKGRREFLPNLLRHMATSAVADTFKCFIRLDDLFNKIIMEWFTEHQFLESLLQIICGTYEPEDIQPHELHPSQHAHNSINSCSTGSDHCRHEGDLLDESKQNNGERSREASHEEKGVLEESEKAVNCVHEISASKASSEKDPASPERGVPAGAGSESPVSEAEEAAEAHCLQPNQGSPDKPPPPTSGQEVQSNGVADWQSEERRLQRARVGSGNAAALLCDLLGERGAGEQPQYRCGTAAALGARLSSEALVCSLLQGMFTSPPRAREFAVLHGCQLLLALLQQDATQGSCPRGVQAGVLPHAPLLHQVLLRDPPPASLPHEVSSDCRPVGGRVGWARLQAAAVVAALCAVPSDPDSAAPSLPDTLITLGTPGAALQLMFLHSDNNLLHARALHVMHAALHNHTHRRQYATHLLLECDLLTKLMDAFEENNKCSARRGHAGHVIAALRVAASYLEDGQFPLPDPLCARWRTFQQEQLLPVVQQHDMPLGGFYPSEHVYEADAGETYDVGQLSGAGDDDQEMAAAEKKFMEMSNHRYVEDYWEPSEGEGGADVADVLHARVPWECSAEGSEGTADGEVATDEEGWAHFGAFDAFQAYTGDQISEFKSSEFQPSKSAYNKSEFDSANFSTDANFPNEDCLADASGEGMVHQDSDFGAFWSYDKDKGGNGGDPSKQRLEDGVSRLSLGVDAASAELANNLLTAMSGMAPHQLADLVSGAPSSAEELTSHTEGMSSHELTSQTGDRSSHDGELYSHAEILSSESIEISSQFKEFPSQVQERPSHVEERPSQVEELPSHAEELTSHAEELPSHDEERPSHDEERPSHAEELPSRAEEFPSHCVETAPAPPPTQR